MEKMLPEADEPPRLRSSGSPLSAVVYAGRNRSGCSRRRTRDGLDRSRLKREDEEAAGGV
jgi:hypothetical protein